MSSTETEQKDKKPKVIEITIDEKMIEVEKEETTPRALLELVGKSAEKFYLVWVKGPRDRVDYKDRPDESIKLKKGMTFITVPFGRPTPVS